MSSQSVHSERTVRTNRSAIASNDTNAGAPKYVVKAAREFVIAIPNQPANRFRALTDGPGHLPCSLRDPLLARMGRAAGEVHPPTADFDEEQHVQPLEPNRVDGKEIDRDKASRLRLKELTPRGTRPSARWTQQCPA
jgi:hypothetical protein